MAALTRFMMSAINAGISAISLGGDQTPQFESPSVDDVLKVKDIIKESSRLLHHRLRRILAQEFNHDKAPGHS
jgi:hypothetical protein